MTDGLSTLYQDLLSGSYDCVDRIVLNAYFRMGHSPGGFRVWWRTLTGSDETLENAYLMRLAGRFSRRVRGYAKAHNIAIIDCSVGERKHDIATEYRSKTTVVQGLFLVLVGRAPAPVWDVSAKHHIERKKPIPYVNHYSFHILDPEWGHLTIKVSGHPPFPAQVILNGHEYVACQARKAGIAFTKQGNCFTDISDAAGLAKIADTLSEQRAIGRLSQVCERWIYTTCLCFALDFEEQRRSGFRYQYSSYQIEYSRNLVFEVGGHMEQVFQALIDRSRAPLDLKTIKTIVGCKHRPKIHRRTKRSAEWEVAVERPTYDLTIFKLHCGKLTLKIYTKGERVLRIEAVAHNTRELNCGRSLEKFPEVVWRLKTMLERFADALSCIDQCFIADELLEQLPTASQVGKTIVGGIDLNKPRMRAVLEALIALSASPNGFTASHVAARVCARTKQSPSQYGPRHAAYDLKKLRGKNIVRRIGHTRRYEPATLAEGNALLPGFIADYNGRFAKPPANSKDLHRPLRAGDDLEDAFAWKEERTLSQALTLQYDKVLFILEPSEQAKTAIGKRVTVVDYPDGRLSIRYRGVELAYRTFDKVRQVDQGAIADNKRLGPLLAMIRDQQRRREPGHRSQRAPRRRDQRDARLFKVG